MFVVAVRRRRGARQAGVTVLLLLPFLAYKLGSYFLLFTSTVHYYLKSPLWCFNAGRQVAVASAKCVIYLFGYLLFGSLTNSLMKMKDER